ncbi:phosphatidylinositol-specific phospholipase C Ecym_2326 [Eremothecium cymbalariae DBVPG|uniref:Phosphatidylinositol-specific phospholipase C X domain-containing protein n=1 Tax=Eremothecium cymbalariae (strain CBS 270.75 / DBVPG 7215 / KCTC 17166 / NRRL Y-17582) TaxID=931890 RepID=G8JQ63_ERECY|nr:Hypothetical protein Ecym_2326 [Eremothecium cymbalariae DBVPG\
MVDDYSNWMKDVDGNLYLSQLSIPGTHNSAACHIALPSVKCQDHTISEQLEQGVRFLDIRLGKPLFSGKNTEAKDISELQVIHGKFPVRIPFPVKFSGTLDEIYKFLDKHPDEAVIVSLKQEGSDSWNNDEDEFPNYIWEHYISKNQDKWYLKPEAPKLQDARGKIVLFRRFGLKDEAKKDHFGIEASWWTYNTTSEDRGTIHVQDYCEVNKTDDIVQKAQYVKDLMQTAHQFNSTNPESTKMFLNFCSGSNFHNPDCWPEKIASKMAQCEVFNDIKKGCGVVVIDYAGMNAWQYPHQIVDCNF